MFKGQWPSSRHNTSQKSLTFHAWSQLPGKANLFEQLSKLKRKKANKEGVSGGGLGGNVGNGGGSTSHLLPNKPEWSNSAEKSVRFTLPPSEVRNFSTLHYRILSSNRNGYIYLCIQCILYLYTQRQQSWKIVNTYDIFRAMFRKLQAKSLVVSSLICLCTIFYGNVQYMNLNLIYMIFWKWYIWQGATYIYCEINFVIISKSWTRVCTVIV